MTIDRSVITGNEEIAVFAAGATLDIEGTFVGALPDGAPSGRGIVIERSVAVGTPATATVDGSIIDGARDAALDVRDGALTVKNTTIRNTSARLFDGCSGQSIRIRSFPMGKDPSSLDVEHTTILDSRQAGVFAASSSVNVTSALIRGVAPEGSEGTCGAVMGDGIDMESYPGAVPSTLSLDCVRIERAQRAGVSAGVGEISVKSAMLACNGRDLVDATGVREASAPTGAVCGCKSGSFRRCGLVPEVLDSWARAGPSSAWPEADVSYLFCSLDGVSKTPLPGGAMWSADSPEIVPTPLRQDSCGLLNGEQRGMTDNVALSSPGFNSWAGVQRRDVAGIHAWSAQPGSIALFAQSGWPIGLPVIIVNNAPSGSIVHADGAVFDEQGKLIPDNRLPGDPSTSAKPLTKTPMTPRPI